MSLQDIINLFRLRWKTLMACVVLGVLIGLTYFLLRPDEYTASSTLYVSAAVTNSPNNAYQGAQLSQQRVSSYVELANSTRVSRQVVQDLGLAQTPEELSQQINASSGSQSVVIRLSVTDKSPEAASAIANSAANVLRTLVDQIESPSNSLSVQAVSLRIVEPAIDAPDTASGGRASVLYGLLGGLAVGVGAVLIANALDTRVRTADDLKGSTNLPILGSTRRARQGAKVFPALEKSSSREAEAYRIIRTNLQFLDVDSVKKIIVFTSPEQGDGKTTCILNTALAMAQMGVNVLLIDADLRRPQIASRLELEGSVGLTSVLTGRTSVYDSIQTWRSGRIKVLTSGPTPPNPSELVGSAPMQQLLQKLRADHSFDYVLLDSAPVLPVSDTLSLAPLTDGAIYVARCNRTRKAQIKQAVQLTQAVDGRGLGAVLVADPANQSRSSYGYYEQAVSQESSTNGDTETLDRRAVDKLARPSPGPRTP